MKSQFLPKLRHKLSPVAAHSETKRKRKSSQVISEILKQRLTSLNNKINPAYAAFIRTITLYLIQ